MKRENKNPKVSRRARGRSWRFLAAAFLASCFFISGLFAQNAKVELAIGYIPHVQFAPLYVGMAKGFYAEEKIDLKIEYGFGVDIFSLLAAGKIDLGLSDSDQLILAGSKGLGLKAVFQYYQKYPVTIVAKNEKIKNPEDFAGKKIGTPELYGTSYLGLQLFLEKYGLKNRVKIERIGYTQLSSLLGDKIEGAVCFFNNEPLQLKASGVGFVQWDVKDFSDLVGASFITSDKVLKEREQLLRSFVRATVKAMDYTIKHQDEAYEISERHIGKQEPAKQAFFKSALAATCQLFEHPQGFGRLEEDKYQYSIDLLARLGIIPKAYPAQRILKGLR